MLQHFIIVLTLFSPRFPGGLSMLKQDVGVHTIEGCRALNTDMMAELLRDKGFLKTLDDIGATRIESECVSEGQNL